MNAPAIEALERLVAIAHGDTGQSRRAADFVLAWWNAKEFGGFDLTDLWQVDPEIAADMLTVIVLIASGSRYPDSYVSRQVIVKIIEEWRPKGKGRAA